MTYPINEVKSQGASSSFASTTTVAPELAATVSQSKQLTEEKQKGDATVSSAASSWSFVVNIAAGVLVGLGTSLMDKGPMIAQLQGEVLKYGAYDRYDQLFLEAVFFAPFLEEFVFRGVVQEGLLKLGLNKLIEEAAPKLRFLCDSRVTQVARIILSAAMFALIHPTPETMATAFIGGVIFGVLKEWQGSLEGVVAAHAVNNFVITALFVLSQPA